MSTATAARTRVNLPVAPARYDPQDQNQTRRLLEQALGRAVSYSDQGAVAAPDITGIVGVANGGTGLAALTAGSLLMGNGAGAVQLVAPGTAGNFLKSNGSSWASAPHGLTYTDVGAAAAAHNHAGVYEPVLGNPAADAYVLSSTMAGARSWVASYTPPTIVATLGALANASGWLHNNGSGTLAWSTPSKADVGLGSVENTALSTWAGSTNLTTLGTIGTGAWNATAISWAKVDKTGSSLADLATRSAGALNSGNLPFAQLPLGSGTWTMGTGATSPTVNFESAANTTVIVRSTGLASTYFVVDNANATREWVGIGWRRNAVDVWYLGMSNADETLRWQNGGLDRMTLTTAGVIGAATWNGAVINSTYGGTGVNNGGRTLTVAGNFATVGAFALTLTTTGATNVTLPTSGTLVTTALTLTAGAGLTGGGDLSANRTFAVTGNLATLAALANAAGWLHNDGAGTLAWTAPVTPAALTKVDDTNVTLTLGGTPATALLQSVSLTLGWAGTLADARIASAATWNAKQTGHANLTSLAGLSYVSASFVKMTGANTFTLDTNSYSLASHTHAGVYEPVLGNPAGDGYRLVSTALGVRSWAAAAALTKTDDTNVTLTLGGSPTVALLAAASITVGWTGTLADARIASAATWNAKQAGHANLTSLSALSYVSASFVKMTAAGTFALDTATYSLSSHTHAGTYEPVLGNPALDGYVLSSTALGVRSWVSNGVPTPAALTKTDDTNVTLTLGGSPSVALLAATSLTLGWTGTLADGRIASAATWNAKQAGHANLTSLAGLVYAAAAFVKMTGANTFTLDTTTYAPTTRTLTASTGLTGGGDLSANRSFAVTGNLATLVALANADGYLHNDGAGALTWAATATPSAHTHPASAVTAGTFPAGAFTFTSTVALAGGIGATPQFQITGGGGKFYLWAQETLANAYQRFGFGYGAYYDGSTDTYIITDTAYNQATLIDENGTLVFTVNAAALTSPQTIAAWNALPGKYSLSQAAFYPGSANGLGTASKPWGDTYVGTVKAGTWNGASIATTYTDAKVTSVAGRTGAVALTIADIGAGTAPAGVFQFTGVTVYQDASNLSLYLWNPGTGGIKSRFIAAKTGDAIAGMTGLYDDTSGGYVWYGNKTIFHVVPTAQFDAAVGVGAAASTNVGLYVAEAATAIGGVVYNTLLQSTLTAAANSDALFGLRVKPTLSVGAFTGTAAYGIYVDAVTGAATNYAIFVAGSASQTFIGGHLGIGTGAAGTDRFVYIAGSGVVAGATQSGIVLNPSFSSGAVTEGVGLRAQFTTDAAAFTMGSGSVIRVQDASKGAGSAITVLYGIKIDNLAAGGSNWSIYTGTAPSYFGASVTVVGTLQAANLTAAVATGTPYVTWRKSDAGADQTTWDAPTSATQLLFRAVNDAYSGANAWLTVTRSGYTISSIVFTGATTVTGNFTATGTTTFNTKALTWPAAYPLADGYVLSSTTTGTLSWVANGGITPAALTRVNDTNVTLTLGGTPATALLQATSLTLGWTGTLADARIASAATWNAKQAGHANLTSLSGLSYVSASFVKMTAAGTFSLDTNTYAAASHTHAASAITTGTFGAGDYTFPGSVTINGTNLTLGATTTGAATFQIGPATPSVDGGGRLLFINSSTQKNWQLSFNCIVGGALEFTPSTVAGGATFTTPVLTLGPILSKIAGPLGIGEGTGYIYSAITTHSAAAGLIRLGSNSIAQSGIAWRNSTDSSDVAMYLNSLDQLSIGATIVTSGGLIASGMITGATLVASGDLGGTVGSYTTLSNGLSAAGGAGTGTVKMAGTTSRNCSGFIKLYNSTTAIWVPYWITITG